MIETVLTPPHPDPLEALLDKPFAGAFDHPAAQRQPQLFVRGIVDMLAMPLQVGRHGAHRVSCCRRQPFHVQGIRQVCQDPVRHAAPQTGPRPDKPPAGPGSPPIQPGRRRLPQRLRRGIKV